MHDEGGKRRWYTCGSRYAGCFGLQIFPVYPRPCRKFRTLLPLSGTVTSGPIIRNLGTPAFPSGKLVCQDYELQAPMLPFLTKEGAYGTFGTGTDTREKSGGQNNRRTSNHKCTYTFFSFLLHHASLALHRLYAL